MSIIKFKELKLKVDSYYDDEDFDSYDYFNIKKKRNADNTDTEDYNCGGYAFETYSWYAPYNTDFDERCDEVRDFLRNGGSVEDAFEVFLQVDTESMLEDFEGRLRVVESERAIIKDDEVLIAYRLRIIPRYDEDGEIYVDHDFHYLVRDKVGWRHKQGSLVPEFIEFTKEPWDNGYDGPIVFFAFKP